MSAANATKRSPSASSTSTMAGTPDSTAGGRKESKRRKVNLACVYCRRSHMTCDDSRPCQRCVKRDIGHLCHDRPPTSSKGAEAGSAARISGSEGSASPDKITAKGPAAPAADVRRSSASSARDAGLEAAPAPGPVAPVVAPLQAAPAAVIPPSSADPQDLLQASNPAPAVSTATATAPLPAELAGGEAAAGQSANALWGNLSLSALGYAPPPSSSATAAPANTAWNSFRSGLGGASWLGLGGGPMSVDGDGVVTQGDGAGGNEFNILSEFLESLDGGLTTPGGQGSSTFVGINGGASQAATPAAAGADGSKQDGDAFVNYDGAGADAAADVLSSYSTLNDAERGAASARTPKAASRPSTPGSTLRRRASTTTGPNGALRSGAGVSAPPALNWASKTERFFITAADQNDGTRDERLGKVIQAKYEAGLLRPYNHVNGYARLNRWMEQNVSLASRRRILKPLSVFRPAFRAVAQSLTNIDLIYIEEAFERLLLDYDRVFSTQGIPACLWRRTGEIYKGNKEFAELVGVEIDALREGRLCIYELMAEESAVNYWEKYGAVSFDPGQKAVLTSCVLKTRSTPRAHKSIPAALAVAAQLPKSTQASTNGDNTPALMTATKSSLGLAGQPSAGPTMPPPAPSSETSESAAASARLVEGAAGTMKTNGDAGAPAAASMPAPRRDAAGHSEIKCCFSFTIRRDQWNIPTMIVGNFLPMQPAA